ncbi:hypothetical protein BGZ70_005743 [Mortierella alpina]|uniref:Uncharacterized protein n=1 Tax=Mortierella alpina TaxID=64518 RepID=A0A9P6JC06_MORAP|nr:hypothetical protein BGZ70_005743 [Mortierella alpina]
MVRLEVDGHTIIPTFGFRSREPDTASESQANAPEVVLNAEALFSESSCKQRDSTEATTLGEFLHALINVDESLGLDKSSDEKEDLQENPAQDSSNDPIVATPEESGTKSDIISPNDKESIEAITPCPEDGIEWIEYHPGKIIHVVHDLATLSCKFSPEAEHQPIPIDPSKVAVPGLTEHPQKPLFPNAAPVEACSPISSSLDDLPESYWLRFRQEMEDVVRKFLIQNDPSAEPEDHHREAFEEAMALSIHRQVERVTRRPAMPSPLSQSISRDSSTSPSSEDNTHDDGVARSMSPESEDSRKSDGTSSSSSPGSPSSDSSSSGSSSPEHHIPDGFSSRSASPEEDGSSRSPARGSSSKHHRHTEGGNEPLTKKNPRLRTDGPNNDKVEDAEDKKAEEEVEEGELKFFSEPVSASTHQASRSSKRTRSPPPLRDSYRPREDYKRLRADQDDMSDRAFTPLTNRQRERDSVATNEPFVFSESALVRFVEDQKGTVHSIKTQAITVSLSSWPIAQKFCKFLCSKQYCGIWLDVSFTWTWGHADMDEFVRAVESTSIQALFLNGYVSQQHSLADPNGQPNRRFSEMVKVATHLQHLILDAPPEDLLAIMKQVRRAIETARPRRAPLVEYQQSATKPPSSVDIQFQHGGKSWVTLQIERATLEIRECSLDLGGSLCRPYLFAPGSRTDDSIRAMWTNFLSNDLSHSLTALRIKNQVDDSWIAPLLEWSKAHRRSKRALLQELQVDCQHISKSGLSDFCELLDEVGSTVTRLRLAHMSSLVKADWILFFQSLNLTVLRTLHVEGANLGDREVRELIGCLKNVLRRDRSVKLTTLTLQKTTVSTSGWKELQDECDKNGWKFSVVSS